MTVADVVSAVLMAAGALFALSGGVGLLRFPDFYTRTHAAGLTDSLGAGLIVLGLLFQVDDWGTGVRLVIIMIFLLLSAPTATHALAHAARRDGVPFWRTGDRRQ